MNLPSMNDLKKLAKACRKLGIKSFKCAEFEFELNEYEPPKQTRRQSKKVEAQIPSVIDDTVHSDTLTEEQLLMWSSGIDIENDKAANT